jgi:hypothetical protein
LVYDVDVADAYYIRVVGFGGRASGCYVLSVTVS